jgi:fermentation-respiration switch protein FrsA (DUF1100 family)
MIRASCVIAVVVSSCVFPGFARGQFSSSPFSWRPGQALENSLLFHPTPATESWLPPPAQARVQDIYLQAADGNRIHAWWFPCPPGRGALLFCHGNAGNLSHRSSTALALRQALNLPVLIFDYPGYGRSDGKPSETGCYAAADAAYEWLIRTVAVAPENIVLMGESLGGGVATDLAVRRRSRALVLVKTFTSIPDMARKQSLTSASAPPVRNQFDNLAKIGRCPSPVFIAHGDRDRVIPLAQSRQLEAAAPQPKRFLLLPGADHNDPLPAYFFTALADFLKPHEPAVQRP